MRKSTKVIIATALVLVGAVVAGVAQARDNVHWSVGIHVPLDPYGATIGTTIGNAHPVYLRPAPVYYEPSPIYYAPPPVVYSGAPVYYYQARPRVVYVPQPIYVPVYRHGHRGHGHRGHGHHRGGGYHGR